MAKLRYPQPTPIRDGSVDAPAPAARPDPRPALMCPISPDLTYELMTGEHADARLRGWVRAAQQDPPIAVAWDAHRHQLIAEAAAHGFQPFQSTKTRPSGAGFETWQAAFFKLYRY